MARRVLPLLLVLAAMLAVPAGAGAVTADYYTLPGTANATAIAAGPDGTVWWAGETGVDPVFGRLLPSAAAPGTSNGVNALPMPAKTPADKGPCCVFIVRSMTVGKDGTEVYFTRSDGILGKASATAVNANNAATAFTLQPVPGRMDLGGIALGPSDTLWFAENGAYNVTDPLVPLGWPGNRMSYATTGLGITQLVNLAFQSGSLASIRYDAGPSGVAISPDGEAWFTEADSGNPGYRVARASAGGAPASTYTEYQLPCVPMATPCSGSYTDTGPVDLAFSPDRTLWYTNQVRKSLGRLSPDRSTFTEYSLASIAPALAAGKPADMASAPDGTVWFAVRGGFSAPGANALVRIAPGVNGAEPTSTVYPLGSGNDPASIAVSPAGDVWFSAPSVSGGTPGRLGRLAGVVTPTTPAGGGGSPAPAPAPGTTQLTPTTRGQARVTPPIVKGPDVLADQICVGPVFDRCALVYIISAGEYVTGFPGAHSSAKKKGKAKAKAVVLARKAVTLKGGERRTIRITLNKKGKALLRKRGRLSVYFTATQAAGDGKPAQVLRRTKLTLKATPKKAKRR